MKNISLILAVLVLVAIFSACGNGDTTQVTPDSVSSDNDVSENTGAVTPSEVEKKSPYNFAAGKFAVNEKGWAIEKYEYNEPLTVTDEVLTFWTTNYMPLYIPNEDYQSSPFPVALEEFTGVNVEYILVPGASKVENFAVLLASDDLCDIMCQASAYYNGPFIEAVSDEGYFINVYDYKEYCPNYIYEVTRDLNDSLIDEIFLKDELIGAFWLLKDNHYDNSGYVANEQWLTQYGKTNDDIVTFDELHDMLLYFKTELTTYPMTLFSTLEITQDLGPGYDTYSTVSTTLNLQYVVDGQVKYANMNDNDLALMTMINQWYRDGLIDPDWANCNSMADADHKFQAGQFGIVQQTAASVKDGWVPIRQPLLKRGQTLHLGCETTRKHYGNASISTTCKNIPLAVSWIDYRYSEAGSILCSYGVEGVTWEWNDEGERTLTEFYYNSDKILSMLACVYMVNQLVDPGLMIQYAYYQYPGGESAIARHEYWGDINYDGAYSWPAGIVLTSEQNDDLLKVGGDITTYISENYLSFVDGSKPLSEWDDYVEGIERIGIDRVIAIYQQIYDDYMA